MFATCGPAEWISLTLVALFVCGCEQKTSQSAADRLVCDAAVVNVGETLHRKQQHQFRVRNASGSPVTISTLGKSCGCLNVHIDKEELAPDEEAIISVDFEIYPVVREAVSQFAEHVFVHVDNQSDPHLTLTVKGAYVPAAYFLETRVRIPVTPTAGASFSTTRDLFVLNPDTTSIESVEVAGPAWLKATAGEFSPVPGRVEARCPITIDGELPSGTSLPAGGVVRIHTNIAGLPPFEISVTVYVDSLDLISCDAERIAFGVLHQDPSAKVIKQVNLTIAGHSAKAPTLSLSGTRNGSLSAWVGESNTLASGRESFPLHCELDLSQTFGAIAETVRCSVEINGNLQEISVPITGFVAGEGK